jgi:N-acetylated-alpha-linked acidic dipeptidase
LIYSDRKTTASPVEVFPGPRAARDGAQRGSVMDVPVYPGDPLTPGVGATPDASVCRSGRADTDEIPAIPISYMRTHEPLLASQPRRSSCQWRDGLPITYRFGGRPGASQADVQLGSNRSTTSSPGCADRLF